jgi:hypothetical protein
MVSSMKLHHAPMASAKYLMTTPSFSMIHFAVGRRRRPGLAYIANRGINRTECRRPYCDGSSNEGLMAPKAGNRRWRGMGHMSIRDRLSAKIIVNHK